jgi:hypothetical protein
MSFFKKFKLLFAKDISEQTENPEIAKLREPQKIEVNAQGVRVESAELFRRVDGFTGYGQEPAYINSDAEKYKD